MDQSSVGSGSEAPRMPPKRSASFFGAASEAPKLKNIDKMKSTRHMLKEEERNFQPKVSQNFLEDWLNYPVDKKFQVVYNSFNIWFVWLRWTSRGMAGLDPLDSTIRARICNQQSILGNAAGLFLLMSVNGFLTPIKPLNEHDHFWVNIFGIIMFAASICLTMYITVSLTAIYPLVECLRDDVAFDAYEKFQRKLGGKESWLFLMGIQLVLVGLLVVARVNYHDFTLFYMFLATVVICGCVQYLGREVFLSLDPISAMHMGLSNDPQEHHRAETLTHYLLRKIPNSLMSSADGREAFGEQKESVKLRTTRRIAAMGAAPPVPSAQVHPPGEGSDVGVVSKRAGAEHAERALDGTDKAKAQADRLRSLLSKHKNHEESAADALETLSASVPEALLPLEELFCSAEGNFFTGVGLSLEDAASVYKCITQAGCRSTPQLISFLKETKQYRPCTCTRNNNADAGSVLHTDKCSSRSASVWTEALTRVGVPYTRAQLVVEALRAHLN